MRDSGYDPVIVIDWLVAHGTRRPDGRFLTLDEQLLDDSHRDTFDRWIIKASSDPDYLIPLGRLDEILAAYDVRLSEFELWAQEIYGTDGFIPTT